MSVRIIIDLKDDPCNELEDILVDLTDLLGLSDSCLTVEIDGEDN